MMCKAVFYAQEAAQNLSASQVSEDLMFLGCVRVVGPVEPRLLERFEVDVDKLAEGIRAPYTLTRQPSDDLTLNEGGKAVIERALDVSRELGEGHVSVEHLLLGIARVPTSALADALSESARSPEWQIMIIREIRSSQ